MGGLSLPGSNSEISVCSQPSSGSFVKTACYSGTAHNVGHDTIIDPCTVGIIPGNSYLSQLCIAGNSSVTGNNYGFTLCSQLSPLLLEYLVKPCISGTLYNIVLL